MLYGDRCYCNADEDLGTEDTEHVHDDVNMLVTDTETATNAAEPAEHMAYSLIADNIVLAGTNSARRAWRLAEAAAGGTAQSPCARGSLPLGLAELPGWTGPSPFAACTQQRVSYLSLSSSMAQTRMQTAQRDFRSEQQKDCHGRSFHAV